MSYLSSQKLHLANLIKKGKEKNVNACKTKIMVVHEKFIFFRHN